MEFANLGYSEEQIELLDVAVNFCREKSPIDKVRALMDSETGYDAAVWAEIAALGWTAIAIPEELGGVGLSMAEVVPVAEQMGRRLMASPFAASTIAAQALIAGGRDEQKAHWLPKIAEGMAASMALYEPHGDWDLSHVTASAASDGDQLRLSGTKQFVQWAQAAQLIIASVSLNGKPALVLLAQDDIPAGALRSESIVDETRRSCALTLDGIVVPVSQLLDSDKAAMTLAHIDMTAALLQSAEMCGGAQSVIDYTVDYMKTRTQFGKVIGSYQALKHPIVNAYVEYEKARSHLYSAAHSFADQGEGEIAVRMAKAAADKTYSHAADRAVQFHGGFGFTHDCDAGLHRRASIFAASQHGDAAWHRAKLADLLLG
ncbi:acyl-CoA dehydrogenase family protein [Sphingorhabdus arenilitoris]|uniref:Acyl-CoA dehydrogenase family protein n=1 Tax=Sphingorhabdus arenilitoris TaxID=1490041 RepID=A0ABV8RJ52_9SPHN